MGQNEFCTYISNIAIKSLLYEVSVSPKPGLVDRSNSGAHNDMDFFTFIDSSVSLIYYFYNCTKEGMLFQGEDKTKLLKLIRPYGLKAEADMFKATNGINTHKGLIFSMGIIAAAAGQHYVEFNKKQIATIEISNRVKAIAKNITKELDDIEEREDLTYGERLYLKYGIKGIRGEVENGFPTVTNYSLPVLRGLSNKDIHINHKLVHVLLHLLENTEDSNILGRHNLETLEYVKDKAKNALSHGGYLTPHGRLYVEEMDKYFIERNISPGGSADLLAITIMLYMLEKGDIK